MNVKINEGCIGCGLCEGTCSSVFSMNVDGKAQVNKQPDESEITLVQDAIDLCPAKVIEMSKW